MFTMEQFLKETKEKYPPKHYEQTQVNKYQQALNNIKAYVYDEEFLRKDINILQELINKGETNE